MKESKSMRDIFKLSFGEEIGNSVSHGTMALLLLFALPAVCIYSYIRGGILRGFGVSVYVICIFLMFLISCIYHSSHEWYRCIFAEQTQVHYANSSRKATIHHNRFPLHK